MSQIISQSNALAEHIYQKLKQEIFDFYLLPHDRFTETQIAERFEVSRTPVRDALYRLQREGYLDVAVRRGWTVRPLDFSRIDNLYDLRVVLESAAVDRICARADTPAKLTARGRIWLVAEAERESAPSVVSEMDENFHIDLVASSGNLEMLRVHREVTEHIRIVRRLDFFKSARVDHTYDEHCRILNALFRRKRDDALLMLRAHIEQSKIEVRKISLSMLADARQRHQQPTAGTDSNDG